MPPSAALLVRGLSSGSGLHARTGEDTPPGIKVAASFMTASDFVVTCLTAVDMVIGVLRADAPVRASATMTDCMVAVPAWRVVNRCGCGGGRASCSLLRAAALSPCLMWLWIAISDTTRSPLLRGAGHRRHSVGGALVRSNLLDAAHIQY